MPQLWIRDRRTGLIELEALVRLEAFYGLEGRDDDPVGIEDRLASIAAKTAERCIAHLCCDVNDR